MTFLTFRFSLSHLRLLKISSQSSSLQTLISAMAGSGEDLSSLSTNTDSVVIDSSNPQIDAASVIDSSKSDDLKYGFDRPEMYSSSLSGTVDPYDRHVFLCYKNAESWPARVEAAEYDPLPSLLASGLKSRSKEIQGKTRLTVCEGGDGIDSSDGDVLIFPEMIKYKGLTHLEVDNFVEEVLVKGTSWVSGSQELLTGSHVFVCSHGSRDRRCGVCGPVLIEKFKEEIELRGLKDQVFVSACSHVGGHKYAGNLIIFSPNSEGKVAGHWYGYVTPDDVPIFLDQHIGKGEIIERLWRGQMGSLNEEDKKLNEQKKLPENGVVYPNGTDLEKKEKEPQDGGSCCQGANGFSCCRDEKVELNCIGVAEEGTDVSAKGLNKLSAWMDKWEQSDVLTTVAVIGAVATVAVAYSVYRRSG